MILFHISVSAALHQNRVIVKRNAANLFIKRFRVFFFSISLQSRKIQLKTRRSIKLSNWKACGVGKRWMDCTQRRTETFFRDFVFVQPFCSPIFMGCHSSISLFLLLLFYFAQLCVCSFQILLSRVFVFIPFQWNSQQQKQKKQHTNNKMKDGEKKIENT